MDEKSAHEERRDGSDGEAKEQLYSEVQVHASAQEERSSPTYMDTRDRDQRRSSSSSSSSSSEDEEAKAEEVAEKVVEAEPEPVEEVNGQVRDGSRRSSASSASSGDTPRTREEDNAEDVMLMAFTHHADDTKPEEPVEYSLKTLENVTLDESSAAPADPSQPDVSLFVKVRHVYGSAGHQARFHFME